MRARGSRNKQPRSAVHIVCEGLKTEPNYFNFMKQTKWDRKIRNMVIIHAPNDTGVNDPGNMVKWAIQFKRKQKGIFCKMWCVFDIEATGTFPNLHNTLEKAKKNEIGIALTNPAFEYWLLLHFVDTTRPFANYAEVTALLKKKHWPEYSKNITVDEFHKLDEDDGCKKAVIHADRIRQNVSRSSPHEIPCPYTTVDELVKSIEGMKPPY